MSIKVLLVDDHEVMREGLSALLRKHPDIEIVGGAADGREALKLAGELQPDVIIMDIAMPNLNGIEAACQMRTKYPAVKIIALSTHSDSSMVSKMLKAGASGYILKNSAFKELVTGVYAVTDNKTYLCSMTSKIVFADYVNMITCPRTTPSDALTGREREVLQLVAEGHTTKEIADILNVSTKTVDSHREHIMEKLDIHNVASLTRYAVREGITST